MNRTARARVVVALWVAFAIPSCQCGGKSAEPEPVAAWQPVDLSKAPDGLDLRLSNGKVGAPPFDRSKLAPAKKLGDAEVASLLARAKPIAADAADRQAFALRPASQPAPRTGTTVTTAFPPPPSALLPPTSGDVAGAGAALKVLRYSPEGKVPIAPELSVTFSQPMVAITSQTDAAKTTPVKLTPTPKGSWRWIGTRTILFDPEIRFPQATTYTVEIPAGTKSATGGVLAAGVKFTFETPPMRALSMVPSSGPQRRDVPAYVLFDQKIDARVVLGKLRVTAGTDPWSVTMLTPAEIEKDEQVKALVAGAKAQDLDGRWLAFRPTQPYPANSHVVIELPAGMKSLEGPNPTTEPQRLDFRTYPPLDDESQSCGDDPKDLCDPGGALSIRFNNELDEDKFDDAWVTIQPAIANSKITVSGSYVVIHGATAPRTKYKMTVGGALRDAFEQTLGTPVTRTFEVGDPQPAFIGPSGMIVTDPIAKQPTLDYFTTGHPRLDVELYKVTPEDFDAYVFYLRNYRYERTAPPPVPGTRTFDTTVPTAPPGQRLLAETSVNLASALSPGGKGHVLAFVRPDPAPKYAERAQPLWVQVTKLGLQVHRDHEQLVAYVSDLQTGKPVANATIELRPTGVKATTDARGLATVELPPTSSGKQQYVLATLGDDSTFVTEGRGWYGGYGWLNRQSGYARRTTWYVTDDRGLYRPGETIAFKGWLRDVDHGKRGDVGRTSGVTEVAYKMSDSRGIELAKGTVPVSVAGAFHVELKLPATPNLGHAELSLTAAGASNGHHHSFRIEEFRRPEFEVKAQASPGPFLVGESGDVTVEAKYFAGGGLPGADVHWDVSATKTTFTPPNRDDFEFGDWQPWWSRHDDYFDDDEYMPRGRYRMRDAGNHWTHEAKTDGGGAHALHLDFLSAKPAMPMAVSLVASVRDVNRQTWSAQTSLIVHPSTLYVGVKAKKPFVEKGTPMQLEVIGVDIDGKAVPGARVEVKAARLDWEYKKGKYTELELEPQTCAIVTAAAPSPCTLQTGKGGTYRVVATIVDAKGRTNQTKLQFWVTGGDVRPSREIVQERIEIIPDKKEYAPGNTAELLLQSPFFPAEGIVMWQRGGIVKTERITLDAATKVITVPLDDGMTPNLHVQVDLVGGALRLDSKHDPDPKLPRRVAFASGAINLPIPPKHRTLKVAVAPGVAKLGPGEAAKIAVEVTDATGKPAAGAEVALVVVDESVLALAGKTYADPIGTFHPQRASATSSYHSRHMVRLVRPEIAAGVSNADPDAPPPPEEEEKPDDGEDESGGTGTAMALEEGKMGKKDSDRAAGQYKMKRAEAAAEARQAGILGTTKKPPPDPGAPIAVRTNFSPLAAFSPTTMVDAAGKATIDIKMPDNLTRYRIVAIAAHGEKQFGKGESAITARLPLMVRPSPPRFLNFGDTFQLPVVVQNQTDSPMTVKLAARSTNAALTDGAGREVTVPANDRIEVMFPAAAQLAGTARFQLVGVAGTASDAAEVALPVWTPATTEAFATYGVIDDGAMRQPVALPGAVVQQFGGLEVTTASTNLQALTDSILYVVHYPFDCAEQRSSRMLTIAGLRDVLSAFKVKDMPSAAELAQSMTIDIQKLSQMQNADGGWGWWTAQERSWPYLTVYVSFALAQAKAKGYAFDADLLERAKQYLRTIESRFDADYPVEARWAIRAFALYARKQLGELDIPKAKALYAEATLAKMNMETAGWLLATMAGNAGAATERAAILRHALTKVSETAGAANFTTTYTDGGHLLLASEHRVDAIFLDALIQEQPASDLIPKLVTGLLGNQKRGRWLNTQVNTFALLALDRYFRTYEKVTPDFVARVWLGNDYAGDHAFRGRTTEYHQVDIPMAEVAARDKQDLAIQKDGKGRLYYRVGMKYAPASLKLDAADYGFVVQRTYEHVDDAKDVTRMPDGTWKIKAGARVRVRVTVANENRRYHVALVDPLPAGLETINAELAMTAPPPTDDDADDEQPRRGGGYRWWGPWYEHQNMRDERTEAFTSLLWEGVHEYVYVARATTPGNFVVPPPKAEEMYMPETFGRGASDRVVIE